MKTKSTLLAIPIVILLSVPSISFTQAPNLRTAANFTLFTITGAMDNTGISQITGNIGTNTGDISGFGTILGGGVYQNDAVTQQCSTDLLAANVQLLSSIPTSTTHTPAFGGGETLVAGVYSIAAAGSVAGTLNLDAQGDANAIFIFKFGGAFTTGASSTINLINGALACNIFWGAEGAIAMAAGTIMKGTLIADNGAISMGDGGTLEGRMLSTTGAVSVYGVYAFNSCGLFSLPIKLLSFTGTCERQNVILKWSTASESNNRYFFIEYSTDGRNWQTIGKLEGAGSSSSLHAYSFTLKQSNKGISYYRLRETDFESKPEFGNVVVVKGCDDDITGDLIPYPNPSNGIFDLSLTGSSNQVRSIEIFNITGEKIYYISGFQSKIDLSLLEPGIYFMKIDLAATSLKRKIIIRK